MADVVDVPCKQQFPLAIRAIQESDSNSQEPLLDSESARTLLSLPRMVWMMNGKGCLLGALWHLQLLPFPPSYATEEQMPIVSMV